MGHYGTVTALANVRALALNGGARAIREAAHLSQAEVAKAVGVTPAAVSLWEAGHRSPQGEAALRWYGLLLELLDAPTKVAP